MKNEPKVKLAISYSHDDDTHATEFIKHLAPLKANGFVKEWIDRKILAGTDYQNVIDNNLEDADIICLLISANFLNSKPCMDEKNNALELRKRKGISVIPIILSDCGWLDDKELSSILSIPKDGKPVSNFANSDTGWHEVYTGLKKVVEQELILDKLKITKPFLEFLENAELLTKAHSQKESVFLDDIFIYPFLHKYDDLGEYEKKESAINLIDDLWHSSKILIEGTGQSGKTTLCKKLFKDLRDRRFIPIYINAKNTSSFDDKNKLLHLFEEQYEEVSFENIESLRIVPIVDDFQTTINKEKYIKQLEKYNYKILFVDDIFKMNLKDENIIKAFSQYKIKEFNPSLRYELIKKWIYLSDKVNSQEHQYNEFYQQVDQRTELVNHALGKILGHGIMPAFPFFILSVISTYETYNIPLDQEITSQGYCYQALIFISLRKQGVRNEDVDTYFNFLTEFSFYLFINNKNELSILDFQMFLKYYTEKFNITVKLETLIGKLQKCQIILLNSLGYYSYNYLYLYYYFVAKYLADHCDERKELINRIISNLHKDDNAYITIFISHHSKNSQILDEILLNALTLFDKFNPSKLVKKELGFFDDQIDIILKEVLPVHLKSPEKKRTEMLKMEDIKEENVENINAQDNDDEFDELCCNIRRSMKTVEVMGQIIKNRAGSLERNKLKMIFEEAMNVHLRVISSFLEVIQKKEGQDEIVQIINSIMSEKIEEMNKAPNQEKLDKLSRMIFWNINFSIVFNYVEKIIKSLGSDKLIDIVEEICDRINTPATVLVKHGILMWYNKNLQLDNISERIKESDFAEISKKMMRYLVVNYASMHIIDFKERQKIEAKLGIPSQRLLIQSIKKSNE
jgi:hypothetical protein